jgi:hypothetical protein
VDAYQQIWHSWAFKLHAWGVKDWLATLLEAVGPLSLLGAQMIYLSQPLLSVMLPGEQLKALSELLEEPDQMQSFINLLRQEEIQ